ERMQATHQHRVWHNRWNALHRQPARHRPYWGDRHATKAERSRWGTQLRMDDAITTVVLSQSPDGEPGRDELAIALQSGVPIILWNRNAQAASVNSLILDLMNGDPSQILDQVRRIRGDAEIADPGDPDARNGRYLALLWDDPNRLVNARGAGA